MRFRRLLILLAIVSTLSSGSWAEQRYAKLIILHTNDTHSHLLPFSYSTQTKPDGISLPAYRNVGGIARRATIINQIRAQNQPLLLVDAGDIIDGSPFSVEFAGEADIAAANAVGYEVMTVGNHEFSNTMADFLKRVKEARFPMLGANVFKINDNSLFLPAYIIKNEAGLRVAVLGVTVPNNYTATKGALTMSDPIVCAAEWVPKLSKEADVVMVLSHLGYDEDLKLAARVPGIDIIVGGHSNTRLIRPVLVKRDGPPQAFSVGGTVIAQAFHWGSELGEVDLIFHKGDAGWSLMSFDGKLIPVTSDVPEDPKVRAVVEKYHSKIAAKYDVVLCEATEDFVGEAAYNLVSDALRENFGVDFSIHNYGGVRTDLVQGPITAGDIADLFPFQNSTLTFQATGAQIKKLLLTRPAVGNIKYRLPGGKLVSSEIGGQPIEDEKVYTGVTNSFYAENAFPKNIKTTDAGIKTREVIIQYLKEKKTISPDNENRTQFDGKKY
jgi:2',3'-cyclic-nucleotide 2'-phosphodiesterase (5'-nucleotidase family)